MFNTHVRRNVLRFRCYLHTKACVVWVPVILSLEITQSLHPSLIVYSKATQYPQGECRSTCRSAFTAGEGRLVHSSHRLRGAGMTPAFFGPTFPDFHAASWSRVCETIITCRHVLGGGPASAE